MSQESTTSEIINETEIDTSKEETVEVPFEEVTSNDVESGDSSNEESTVEVTEIEPEEKDPFDPDAPIEDVTKNGIYVKLNVENIDDPEVLLKVREDLYNVDLIVVTHTDQYVVGPFERETNAFVAKNLIFLLGYKSNVIRM